MAVDPKVVGGGAAVVAIGGGSGYAISQATSSSETKQTPQPSPEEIKAKNKTTNKKALETLGFVVTENTDNEGECKTNLEKKVLYTEEDFKGAVNSCVKGKKFSDKAEQLGLDILKDENKDKWGSDNNWWTNNKNTITPIVSAANTTDWTTAKTHLVGFCVGTENTKGNKAIDNNSTDTDWKNFLKACTKDKSTTGAGKEKQSVLLIKDFWTGKVTTQNT